MDKCHMGMKIYGPLEQEVEIGASHDSGIKYSKRQPGGEVLPNSEQEHPKWHGDQVLTGEHYIKMVSEGKAVSLRKSDCWLNATEVLKMAGKTANDRNHTLRILKKHTSIQVVGRPLQSWIPYQDGYFLCEFLQLTDTLRPLLEYGKKQGMNLNDQTNYLSNPEFLTVQAGQTMVSIRSADMWINVTHILKAGGYNRSEAANVRGKVKHEILRGDLATQGTYVDPQAGLDLCKEYKLEDLESILRSYLERCR